MNHIYKFYFMSIEIGWAPKISTAHSKKYFRGPAGPWRKRVKFSPCIYEPISCNSEMK